MEDEKFQKLKNYGFKLLSLRPRSIKEFQGKITHFVIRHGYRKTFIQKLIKEFSDQNLLNDEEFSLWWLDQRRGYKPKGRKVIEMELARKGIDKKIISSIFDKENDGNIEIDNARKIVQKKLKIYHNLSKLRLREKLIRALLTRGFDWDTIEAVIDSKVKKE